ncbi:CapA family protein [Nonomuraea sp. B12E4]|uniref:CapA family protein n=1 Tax=Nonomuraea sp. B12E4 TaxID=3153564 RepID=UPI00325CA99C
MRIPRAFPMLVLVATLTSCSATPEREPQRKQVRPQALSSPESQPPVVTPSAEPTPERRPYTISFGGDVHFEGVLRGRLSDPDTALGPIAEVLRGSDLSMVNLETAITTGGTPAPKKKFTFRAPPSALTALKRAGVDVASMANNHGMDYMESGLADSLAAIKRSKFPVVGIGKDAAQAYKPFRKTVNGNRVAIIGATQVLDAEFIQAWTATADQGGLASAKDETALLKAVRKARKSSDTVIVHLHWGTEMQKCPNEAQRSLAPKLVKAGADVVVGGHAHILLGAGYLDDAYISYGLGNFVFYNSSPGTTGRTGVLTLTINGRKVLKDRWTPATIEGGVPVAMTGTARTEAIADWKELRACTGLAARP